MKEAVKQNVIEPREPQVLCFDVLVQFLMTLAIGDGFFPEETYERIKEVYTFQEIRDEEWKEIIDFLTIGGSALKTTKNIIKWW